MCGFLGFTYRDEKLLQKLSEKLKDRAVDRDYYFYENDFSFYHAHLAISDLNKNTSQPFFSENIIVGFVGEIYNKQKLLDFIGNNEKEEDFTELEVIFKSYKKFGKKFISFVNGEFAIVIYDKNIGKLFLFRDRWGTNNVYYKMKDGNLYFSSEIKSLIFEKPKVSKSAFIEYLTFQFCISPNTLIDGIFSLEPGCILEFSDGEILKEKLDEYVPQYNFSNILEAVEYSVKSRIPKFQEKIFLSLSGGPDSNLILFFLKKYFQGGIIAYSFETSRNSKEIDIARENTKKLGIEHLVIDMEKYDFSEIESDIFHHEGLVKLPNLGKILKKEFPQFTNVKVEFGGDGKEELINSNTHFPYENIFAKYKYFKERGLIKDFEINQEFLNKKMFDFNLQMIDKITLRNGIERRLPFTDYELLKFANYKNYRKEAEKFLNENGLRIVEGEFGYNLGIQFDYLRDNELNMLKNILMKKFYEVM